MRSFIFRRIYSRLIARSSTMAQISSYDCKNTKMNELTEFQTVITDAATSTSDVRRLTAPSRPSLHLLTAAPLPHLTSTYTERALLRALVRRYQGQLNDEEFVQSVASDMRGSGGSDSGI